MNNRTSPASCVRDTVLTLGSIGEVHGQEKEKRRRNKMINADNIYLKKGLQGQI